MGTAPSLKGCPIRVASLVTKSRFCWPHRGLFPRFILLTMVGIAIAPRPSRADIIYTWQNEAEGGVLSGLLEVSDAALAKGQIDLVDVVYFTMSWGSGPGGITWNLQDLQGAVTFPGVSAPSFPFHIDPVSHGPTDIGSRFQANKPSPLSAPVIVMEFNSDWNKPGGQSWFAYNDNLRVRGEGQGHWAITIGSVVPEPASLILLGMAGVCVAVFGLARRHTAQRR